METQETKLLELELKYCERCGTLWLRLRGSEVVVCRSCARALAGLPGWRGTDHSSDLKDANAAPVHSAFWAEGGNA
jgi:hypothetical protein